MGRPSLPLQEVRNRFTALGHTPKFSDGDYETAQSKLEFMCGNCGEANKTTCAALNHCLRKGEGKGYCSLCSHNVGVAAAADSNKQGSYRDAVDQAKSKGLKPLFRKADFYGIAKINLSVRCIPCGNEFLTSVLRMREMRGIGCSKCAAGKVQSARLETKRGVFNYKEAATHFGLSYGSIIARKRYGWTDDQACGIDSPPLRTRDPNRQSWVYGWWCLKRNRYVYIGVTLISIKARINGHKSKANTGGTAAFSELLRSEGIDTFEVHEIWTGPACEAADAERWLIAKHKTLTVQGGYNSVPGGSLGRHGGIAITHRGIEYPSISALARHFGVEHWFVARGLRNGLTTDQIAKAAADKNA
jgi:hypothetical protein